MRETLLIIEDEELLRTELARHYRQIGWTVAEAPTAAAAASFFRAPPSPLVVLCDLNLPDGEGLEILQRYRSAAPAAEWIMLTGFGTVPDSVRALRLGAFDFVEKPCPLERLDLVVNGAARSVEAQWRLREQAEGLQSRYPLSAFVGESRQAEAVRDTLSRLAALQLSTVLITGETGVGKGLVARILHYAGARRDGPLVEVNCAALPPELLESELFGHEPGAFTGARGRHRGLFEQANGGTLLLDEISELNARLQPKLLKVVEERRLRRVGGEREFDVDVQVFAATNRDLPERVETGAFRQDLYHRLSVFGVDVPPLRDRPDDIEPLVAQFVAEFNLRSAKRVQVVPASAWTRLRSYRWPGNVRELRNVIERSVLLAESATLPEQWLPASDGSDQPGQEAGDVLRFVLDGRESLPQWEERVLRAAVDHSEGNVTAAARLLGLSRQTLRYRLEKYSITGG